MYYLTAPFTRNFGVNTLPCCSRRVNGMVTKTNAVKHALKCKVISDLKDLDSSRNEDLLIEPLFFKEHATDDAFERCIEKIRAFTGKKVLLCSEMEPLRWPGRRAKQILGAMDTVLASCNYQSKLLEAINIKADKVVYEPVNEHLFFPAREKEDWVVAVGSPTLVKNVDALIEIFTKLEGSGFKRVFIGGPIVWGEMRVMRNERGFDNTMKKFAKLKSVTDIFHKVSPQTQIAYVLSKAKYYLNFAWHEVCCRTAMEAMLSGVGVLTGSHPLFEEYPCVARGMTPSECVDLMVEGKPDVQSDRIREWAVNNISYEAFSKQLRELL